MRFHDETELLLTEIGDFRHIKMFLFVYESVLNTEKKSLVFRN